MLYVSRAIRCTKRASPNHRIRPGTATGLLFKATLHTVYSLQLANSVVTGERHLSYGVATSDLLRWTVDNSTEHVNLPKLKYGRLNPLRWTVEDSTEHVHLLYLSYSKVTGCRVITMYMYSLRGYTLATHTRTAPSNTHLAYDSLERESRRRRCSCVGRWRRSWSHGRRAIRLPELAHVAFDHLVNCRAKKDVLPVVMEASDAL